MFLGDLGATCVNAIIHSEPPGLEQLNVDCMDEGNRGETFD
jgi:hypothetical protein